MGFTANQVTLFAGLLSVICGVFLAFPVPPRWFLILPLIFFLRMALNAIDGIMARECDQKSRLGAYLNELTDVVSDAFIMLPFAFTAGGDVVWIAVTIVLSTISEMAGTIGTTIGASRRYDGPMGKSDRAVIFGALGIFVGSGWPGAPQAVGAALPVVCAALVLTILNRVMKGLAEAKENDA